MYDLHDFRDISLLRVTFFKAFTSMQRVFLQRLQNAGRRNLICEIALLTCAHQEKKPFPSGRTVGLAGKGVFLLQILSSSLTSSFVTSFLLSAVDDMHALTSVFKLRHRAPLHLNPMFTSCYLHNIPQENYKNNTELHMYFLPHLWILSIPGLQTINTMLVCHSCR